VPEVYVPDARGYEKQPAGAEGWTSSAATGVQLRPADGKLAIQMIDDPQPRRLLPED